MARAAKVTSGTLTDSRLVIVSGKGGVGKTTVSAAIAMAAASLGKRVLVIEVEQRDGLSVPFGGAHPTYEERAIAPNITGLSVVPDEALVEYLYLFYGIGKIARPLLTGRAVEFATSTAPGLRDILLIGKVKEAENRRIGGEYVYDLLILDAPPTGRLPRFLDAPRAVVDLVSSGAIRQQAQGVRDMLTDSRRTRVVLVCTPEEMPVTETNEAIEHLGQMNMALGPIVINGLFDQPFTVPQQRELAKAGAAALLADAMTAGIALSSEAATSVATVAGAHARRATAQRRAVRALSTTLPRFTLPALMTPVVGPDEVRRLASSLTSQGAVR